MSERSLAEHLTAQFYAWERRGRGWDLFPDPVMLEPPFRPFQRYLPLDGPAPDDGRIPGLVERATRWMQGRPAASPPQPIEIEEPEPELDSGDADLVEFQIRMPERAESSPELASHLLAGLASVRHRVAFELVGIGDTSFLQFVADRQCADAVRSTVETYVRDVALAQRPTLIEAWEANAGDASVIVDFGLSNECVLPLSSPRSFAIDPLLAFLAVFEELADDEVAVLQVLFEPTTAPWHEHMLRALTDGSGGAFFSDAPEFLSLAREKMDSAFLACVVRVAARSPDSERAWHLARRLGRGLGQFARAGANEFLPLDNRHYVDWQHDRDFVRRRSRRTGMLLSLAELSGLVHVPAPSVRSEALRSARSASHGAPSDLRSGDVLLGENEHRGRSSAVFLGTQHRLRHCHLIGATGTGKSTLLKSLIRQDLEAGRGIALLDPHGDLADEVLGLVPNERLGDVVLFDPSDEEFPIGFNVLGAHSDRERNLLASDLTAIFRRFSTSWGDQMTAVLSSAVMVLLESPEPRTLLDLRRFLTDADFRATVLETGSDPLLNSFWRSDFPRLPGARSQLPITTRLDAFLRPKSIRNMVAQPESPLDLRRLMDGRGIFIGKLSQGAIGEENAHLLGSLLVAKFHQLAMSREQIPESDRSPFFLYLDEFHHFLTPSLTGLLTGARKYGVGLVMAHQAMRQLGDQEIRGSVLANPAVRICFRLGDDDARLLASGFASFGTDDLVNLGVGEAICRVGQSGHDFNVRVPEPLPPDPRWALVRQDAARENSRERYGAPREDVEALIAEMWQLAQPARRAGSRRSPGDESAQAAPHPASEPPQVPERSAPVAEPTATPPERAGASATESNELPTPGRGGARHKYLQGLIKQAAEAKGYRATIEGQVGEYGRADVLLERGEERIAIEISVTTSPEHEFANVEKCLRAEVTRVVVVSPETATLERLRALIAERVEATSAQRITLESPSDFIASLESPPDPEPTLVRGYRIKTSLATAGGADAEGRRDEIAKTVAAALRRLRRG